MPTDSFRLIVLADQNIARVQSSWPEFEQFLKAQSGIELVAVDLSGDLDLRPFDADIALVLGGDGAILRACRQMGERQLPILGINLGRLGFLAALSPPEFREHFTEIVKRDYRVVPHLMYECQLTRANGAVETFLGLNEVVISAGGALRMIDVRLAIDGEVVTTYSGDGVILSTPVGSTAHSLSAGGPILRQDLQAFVITPICPHALTNRPLIDSAECTYTLTAPDAPEGTTLVIDGQIRIPIGPHHRVDVRRASVNFQKVEAPGNSYYATLHRKLGWGGQTQSRSLNPNG